MGSGHLFPLSFCFFPSCLQWASPIVKRHLLTNSFLPFPQDRKTLTFYLQEQGDNTRSIVIMWSSPSKRLKTEPMCAGSGVTDPHLSTSSDLQGARVQSIQWGQPASHNAPSSWERVGINKQDCSCSDNPSPQSLVGSRTSQHEGQWAELQHQLRHPPRPMMLSQRLSYP